ncbi:MAG TPA: NAD(P)-binding protein [Candidatus Margulisiibacteriota bacterium]|nr:NAD(P)-binding protein [Candidatus Margulisiibacteriota bacterium]
MSESKAIKVAIIGGGCAAITAAFELTRPEHHGRYQVTVYQLGWRLGGKGASGRGVADRIEEHGLHLWMGWYENAFRLMRECYAELNRDPRTCPIADWRDAFAPLQLIGIPEKSADGQWSLWKANLPPTEGLPGDPFADAKRWSVADYMKRSFELLRALLQTIQSNDAAGTQGPAAAGQPEPNAEAERSPPGLLDAISRLLRYGELASLAGLIQAVELLELATGSLARYPENVILRFLDAIAHSARTLLEARLERDPAVRRVWEVIDLTLATLRGEIRFGILTDPRGFDAIDEYDCREWLLLNGASERSVNSGFMKALYDLGFSYADGDPSRPRIAAGQALRATVRAFFTYRGAFFWTMQAGMGDVVFAPFYEVLRRRGVRFEFFHRLENVKLATRLAEGESPYVEALEFDVQAEINGGGAYEPLVEIQGLPCWPSTPDYRQLVDGERCERERWDFESHWDRRKLRTQTLRVTDDFDFVVLGVSLGAIPHVCKEIVARDPRWRAMVDHVKTVATQAFQIWLSADMKDLGWTDAPIVVCGFTDPFDTWADMRHLLSHERWPQQPQSLAYFCNVLPEPDGSGQRADSQYPALLHEQVRRSAMRFLNRDIVNLWPQAVGASGAFRWDLLVDPKAPHGPAPRDADAQFASQYWRANINPSDRYALSLPGSSAYRISPLDATYDNLTIAGDWTDCGFNAGCVEAAVISGRLAAHAIAQSPRLEDIVGFDHP